MKQIGNLAIVCARRKDVTLRIEQGRVMVLLSGTYAPAAFSAYWDNDETILSIIHELNFGRCASKSQCEPKNGRKKPLSSISCGN